MNKLLTAALLTAGLLLTTFVRAEPQSRQVPVPDYTVFVDPPTRFVFVKLPTGWKFAGRIEAQDMDHLPSTVVTALLKPEAGMAELGVTEHSRTHD